MRALLFPLVWLAACGSAAPPPVAPSPPAAASRYPAARVENVVDDYHGHKVADPYRWLEDVDSAETAAWVKAQNELTSGHLATIPERAVIRERLVKLWNYERPGIPVKKGGRLFYTRVGRGQDQPVLYVTDADGAPERVLLDANTLSSDGTLALANFAPSPDGRLLAYTLAAAGSDWDEVHILDVASGAALPDTLRWVKFSLLSWSGNSRGIYYTRWNEPAAGKELEEATRRAAIWYHRVATGQAADHLVHERSSEGRWERGRATGNS